MRRLCAISAILFVSTGIFLGCSRQAPKNDDDKKHVQVDPGKVNIQLPGKDKVDDPKKGDPKKVDPGDPIAAADDKMDKYEAALGDALSALAERKFADALEAFELAKSIDDTEFVRGEIAKLKERVDQQGLAKNAVKNIEIVLNDGNADDAAKLANDALKEFGDGDDADKLLQLRIQAEAIRDADKKEGAEVRFARFKKEGEVALAEKNLRAAALALEQALEAKQDAGLKATYDDVRGKLDDYDALRKKGLEFRRDPLMLEDALDAFERAGKAWDTLQIRADIDDAKLALTKKRDTIAVADFELRNDVGMPGAGGAVAEELLPRLKPKFDLVERGQLRKVLGELKVQQGFLDDARQQQQIGKLSKARYLVVGSVQRLVGVTIRARLVDTQTGLVVQTGKVVAINFEEALNQIPDLAKQLMMNDEAKAQFDAQMFEKAAVKVAKVGDDAVLPAAPLPPVADMPPPPPPAINPAPPVFLEAKPKIFENFVPPPANFVAPQVDPLQVALRDRLLFATIERGDFLFRVGRFREAQRNFEFALALAPENFDIRLRLERVAPFVPPGSYFFAPRPRIVIMPFMTVRRTFLGPPDYLTYWTPNQLAGYFSYRYDVVDPAEVYWYMGRMGLTMNDLMLDPNARRWLGRAIGVRYFVFGNHIETTSFDVNTYFVDAEFGYLRSSARINVRDVRELKLRLQELAELTTLTPAEQVAYQQNRLLNLIAAGRKHFDQGRYHQAVAEFEAALAIYPFNAQVLYWLRQAEGRARFEDFQRDRNRRFADQQAAVAAQRQRQWDLARQAEIARQNAIAEAAARSEAQRKVHIGLRVTAQGNLITRAEVALQTKNFGVSVSFFQGAMGLARPVDGVAVPVAAPINYQSLAQARLEADRAEQLRFAQVTAAREAAIRAERDKQLAAAQKQILAEHAAAEAALNAERNATLAKDDIAFKAAIKQGQQYMTQKKYEAALAAFQGAQRVAHGQKQQEQVNTYIDIIVQAQAEALATTKEDKAAVESKLLRERERRKAAEAEAKANDDKYQLALTAAQAALTAKNYDTAEKKFEEAKTVFRTDAVLTGLKQVETARAADLAKSQQGEFEKKKDARIKQLIADGKAALAAKKYGDALSSYSEAKKLAPENLDVLAGLTQAESANASITAEANRKNEEANRTQNFQRLLKSGQANLAAKQYEAAVANLGDAVKLNPTDATALAALKQAEKARDGAFTDAKSKAAAKERADQYQKLMTDGRLALDAKRFAEASKYFGDAQKLLPGDKASQDYLAQTQTAKKAAEDAIAAAAKQRAAEVKLAADLQDALTKGRAALAAKDFTAAAKALTAAQKLAPENADVKNALRDYNNAKTAADVAATAEKQRLTNFQAFLATGKTALNAKKYPEALKALSNATALMPTDKEAQDLFRRAQLEARQADEAAAKGKLQELITTGLANIKTMNYDAAEKALRSAAQVDPTNPQIVQGLKDIQAARQAIADQKQLVANYNLVMTQGQKALQSKDYKSAIAAGQQALKLFPNDKAAQGLIQQATTAQNNAGKTAAQFQNAMAAGQKAMKAKDYKSAVAAFTDATNLDPTDANARQLLAQARQALQDAGKTKDPPKVDYDQSMQRGNNAEKDFKFGDALKAFQDALKAKPNDKAATSKSQFAQAIVNAEQAIANSMWVDAAREADNALRIQPKHPYALKLQQRAKNKK